MAEKTKNNVNILGRLGRDPDYRISTNGMPIARLSVATNRTAQDGRVFTEWHRVTVFGAAATAAAENLVKGSRVDIEGSLRYNSYTDNEGIVRFTAEIVANPDGVGFLGEVSNEEAPSSEQ